jgi:hypothetical protein
LHKILNKELKRGQSLAAKGRNQDVSASGAGFAAPHLWSGDPPSFFHIGIYGHGIKREAENSARRAAKGLAGLRLSLLGGVPDGLRRGRRTRPGLLRIP